MRARFPSVLVVLVLFAGTGQAGGWNDADGVGDAGSTPSTAAPFTLPGTFYGRHDSGSDADWYAASAGTGPICVSMDAVSTTWAEATLRLTGLDASSVAAPIVPDTWTPTRISLASGGAEAAQIGLVPIRDPETGKAPEGGYYRVQTTLLSAGAVGGNDAGGDGDAANALGGARAVGGGCIGGRLEALAFDTRDVYSFNASAGQQVVYSLGSAAGVGVTLSLLDSTGAPVGPEILSEGVASVVLPSTGSYFLSTSTMSASGVDYVLGLIGPDPPSHPCRPHCRVAE